MTSSGSATRPSSSLWTKSHGPRRPPGHRPTDLVHIRSRSPRVPPPRRRSNYSAVDTTRPTDTWRIAYAAATALRLHRPHHPYIDPPAPPTRIASPVRSGGERPERGDDDEMAALQWRVGVGSKWELGRASIPTAARFPPARHDCETITGDQDWGRVLGTDTPPICWRRCFSPSRSNRSSGRDASPDAGRCYGIRRLGR